MLHTLFLLKAGQSIIYQKIVVLLIYMVLQL